MKIMTIFNRMRARLFKTIKIKNKKIISKIILTKKTYKKFKIVIYLKNIMKIF